MSKMQIAFELESQNGCIVVRDTESDGDVSAWDPAAQQWYVDRGSAIFAVRPGIEGLVRCEVWRGTPLEPLPVQFFIDRFQIEGALQVEDPAGVIDVELAHIRGEHVVQVLVDNADWPERVQVVIDPVA